MACDGTESKTDWYRKFLEIIRVGLFIFFYALSFRIIFVILAQTAPIVSIFVGAAVISIAILTWWKVEWALYGFVTCIPVVSGFQMIGFMRGLPLLSAGFAGIYTAWLSKRLIWQKKNIQSEACIGNIIDILSAIILISLIIFLVPYPIDFVFRRLFSFSFVGQDHPFYSVEGSYVLLQGLFFYRMMEIEVDDVGISKKVISIISIQVLMLILFSLFQWVFDIPPKENGLILYAPFDDKHSYGSYVVLVFFVFLSTIHGFSTKYKILSLSFLGTLFVLIILCWSRATWFALIAMSTALFVLKIRRRKSIVTAFLCCGLIVLTFINLNPNLIEGSDNKYVQRLSRLILVKEMINDWNVTSRLAFWGRAVGIMEQYPLVGSGVGSFYRVSQNWSRPEDKQYSGIAENAHNYYLQFGADLGIPALLIFLSIIFYTYRVGLEVMKKGGQSKDFVKGLLFGLSAFLITMVTGHPLLLSNQQFIFWFVIAVISIMYRGSAYQLTHQ